MMLQSMQGFVRPILVSDRHRLQRNVEKGRPCERSPASDPTRQHRAFMRAFVQPLDALRDEIRSQMLDKVRSLFSVDWARIGCEPKAGRFGKCQRKIYGSGWGAGISLKSLPPVGEINPSAGAASFRGCRKEKP